MPDRLSPQELANIQTEAPLEVYMQDVAARKEVFESRPVENTFQGMSLPLIRYILDTDPSVKKIVEIGAYYGYVLNVLATEYPHVQIHGMDMVDRMPEMNAEFSGQPNLTFSSGYGLEALESGEISGDLFYFVSTSTRFKNLEFKKYFEQIRKVGQYVVLNELLTELPDGFILDPDLVDPDESVPAVYANSHPDYPPLFIHNYRKIAEQMGFEVLHFHVFTPAFTSNHYRVEMVAKKRG